MLRINQKGQSYSTFKLLISAIVAVAILAVLMQILGMVDIFQQDPNALTKQELTGALTNLGAPQIVKEAIFSNGTVLSAQAISDNSGIEPTQLCMGISAVEDSGFELLGEGGESGVKIQYGRATDKKLKIIVICNYYDWLVGSDGDLETYEYTDLIDISDCEDTCPEDGKCCAVMLTQS